MFTQPWTRVVFFPPSHVGYLPSGHLNTPGSEFFFSAVHFCPAHSVPMAPLKTIFAPSGTVPSGNTHMSDRLRPGSYSTSGKTRISELFLYYYYYLTNHSITRLQRRALMRTTWIQYKCAYGYIFEVYWELLGEHDGYRKQSIKLLFLSHHQELEPHLEHIFFYLSHHCISIVIDSCTHY